MKAVVAVKVALVASLYAAMVTLLAPISFYAFQVRVADALLLLPFLDFFGLPSVIGLAIGCAIANALSPFGLVDVAFGSLANFLAGLAAWAVGKWSKGFPALLLAALLEALIVSWVVGYFVLHLFGGVELSVALVGVFAGSALSICVLGVSLALFLLKGLRLR